MPPTDLGVPPGWYSPSTVPRKDQDIPEHTAAPPAVRTDPPETREGDPPPCPALIGELVAEIRQAGRLIRLVPTGAADWSPPRGTGS